MNTKFKEKMEQNKEKFNEKKAANKAKFEEIKTRITMVNGFIKIIDIQTASLHIFHNYYRIALLYHR